jgi:hypothetical protein
LPPPVLCQCPTCQAVTATGEVHECPVVSDNDRAAVRTIQDLCAAGLTPEEIATDMGVVLGWRVWNMDSSGLHGAGTGSITTWPMDAPMLAVCVESGCRGRGTHCGLIPGHGYDRETKPICRIHALKQKADHHMGAPPLVGAVALWGEVIECETGYLATRAYPLALPSPVLARAYRVCHLATAVPLPR